MPLKGNAMKTATHVCCSCGEEFTATKREIESGAVVIEGDDSCFCTCCCLGEAMDSVRGDYGECDIY